MKKQFIAGAVCPQCNVIDKIQLVSEVDERNKMKSYHECVACGYHRSDAEFDEWEEQGKEPLGATTDPEIQSVQIMQPKKTL